MFLRSSKNLTRITYTDRFLVRLALQMFWDTVEAVQERTLQQMVEDPNTKLDDVLNHDYCFQEVRLESKYLIE